MDQQFSAEPPCLIERHRTVCLKRISSRRKEALISRFGRVSQFTFAVTGFTDSMRPVLLGALTLLLLIAVLSGPTSASAASVKASRGEMTLPTYPWRPAVKHPYFRGTDGKNIYPYPMLDNLSREKTSRTYRTVVLENEYLRITFLPELGGRIHEVIDKTTGQPMFYVNHVIKPGLIGQCGAWISGGVEWNTGPQGHTVGCMQPVDVAILPPDKDGSRSVAIGETEKIYGTQWTVVVTLRPGRSFIEERIRIYNPTDTVRPYYFWNCTAVPNPPGFRFIYPMTLGSDHGATKFFHWPFDHGKDLTRGTNYQDGTSIFAWHCDQDFFGLYDDGAQRGVVAYANHHLLPGKKAWTWGQGSYGRMHQMDLTDTDGPYNEVQTGPLLTQADVGRLEPCEAVSWREWWYPIHALGGFTYANRDVAVNAAVDGSQLRLRLLGTGKWSLVEAQVLKGSNVIARSQCKLSPAEPAELKLDLAGAKQPFEVRLTSGKLTLAQFRVPLALPERQPPEKSPKPQTASELAQAGWQEYLFARCDEAEKQFRQALGQDKECASARIGLALLNLDSEPATAATEGRAAVAANPDDGLGHFALAVAALRTGDETTAADEAWKAALDPATAVPGRALAARLLIRKADWTRAIQTLSAAGPWQSDPVCRNYLALALLQHGDRKAAVQTARANLEVNPLDAFARSVLWLAHDEKKPLTLAALVQGNSTAVLDLAAQLSAVNQTATALPVLREFYCDESASTANAKQPLPFYWAAYLAGRLGQADRSAGYLHQAQICSDARVFPHRHETLPVLRWAVATDANDGKAALYLGHLLFSLGRYAEGRDYWIRATRRGIKSTIPLRALGMASLRLDHDASAAAKFLRQAHEVDPQDAIVARDLAQVLFNLADKADSADRKRELWTEARNSLQDAFPAGQGRSDFVALLARAQDRLGDYAAAARMLDSVRVTVWEGAREVHDLFEAAHLELGKEQLESGHAAEALKEFNRALEYPENLATGKLESTREAHIQYLRGNALVALGRKEEAIAAWKLAAHEPASKDAEKEAARQKAREALKQAWEP